MQVPFDADHNIQNDKALAAWIAGVVESALSHSSDHITRVEVRVSDENGRKRGQRDKRCMMAAQLEGRGPVAVTDHASTMDRPVNGAVRKLGRMIESDSGRDAEFKARPC